MNIIEQATRITLLTRVDEWYDKVLAVTVCTLLIFLLEPGLDQDLELIGIVAAFTSFLGCYGYTLNSFCDRESDRKVGRRHMVSQFSVVELKITIGISLIGAIAILAFLGVNQAAALGLVTLLLITAYSARPFRLKERGVLGLIVGGTTQRAMPFAIAVFSLETYSLLSAHIFIWLVLLGLATMMAHQLDDLENDRMSGVVTWALTKNTKLVIQVTVFLSVLLVLHGIAPILLFEASRGLVVMLVLLLLGVKPLLWAGEIVVRATRNLQYVRAESKNSLIPGKQVSAPLDPSANARSYLLQRIRSEELVTRATDDCVHKDWDWMGESYLSLNAVIALGSEIGVSDRDLLVNRITRFQEHGTWDYANGGRGPDVDTTASAIRALDRLGLEVSLDGLYTFRNPESGLFNTFKHPQRNHELCLPPQSSEGHRGAHPCVLPNVWLLLLERNQLQGIDRDLLKRMVQPDGKWISYYYASPYYSTRLFSELLCRLGPDYYSLLQPTLSNLLSCTITTSPTQNAEIAIALHHFCQCFPDDAARIRKKAKVIINTLENNQLSDGSWHGDVIWKHVHLSHPKPVNGFDCFRVHSTSLCTQALACWKTTN